MRWTKFVRYPCPIVGCRGITEDFTDYVITDPVVFTDPIQGTARQLRTNESLEIMHLRNIGLRQ